MLCFLVLNRVSCLSLFHYMILNACIQSIPFFTSGRKDDGSMFKAALLSGPPGVGKTTSASLVCFEKGFTYIELNASDTRNKRTLQETVKDALGICDIASIVKGQLSVCLSVCRLSSCLSSV